VKPWEAAAAKRLAVAAPAPGGFVELFVDLEETREGDFGGLLVGAYRQFHKVTKIQGSLSHDLGE
jgi:hypothetical protein